MPKISSSSSRWQPVTAPVTQQLLLWILTGFLADFGDTNLWVTYAIVTFWPVAFWIMFLRRDRLSRVDAIYLRYGFPILAFIWIFFGSGIQMAALDYLPSQW